MTSALPPPPSRPSVVARRRGPGLWIGLGLVALGGVVAVALVVLRLPEFDDRVDDLHRATVDEPATFVVDEPVEWAIFIEPSNRSQSGLRYLLLDEADRPVPLGRGGGASYDLLGTSGREIAAVSLPPGRYRLEVVSGRATLAIGDDPTGVITGALALALITGLPLVVGGAVLAVVSAIRDTRDRTRSAEPPPPSPWSAGEWPADSGR